MPFDSIQINASSLLAAKNVLPIGRIDFEHDATWAITTAASYLGFVDVLGATGIQAAQEFAQWLLPASNPQSVVTVLVEEILGPLLSNGKEPKSAVVCFSLDGVATNQISPSDVCYLLEYDAQMPLGIPAKVLIEKGTPPARLQSIDVSFIGKFVYQTPLPTTSKYEFKTVDAAYYSMSPNWANHKQVLYPVSTEGVVGGYLKKGQKTFVILQQFGLNFLFPYQIDMSFVPIDVSSYGTVPTLGSIIRVDGMSKLYDLPFHVSWNGWGDQSLYRAILPDNEPTIIRGTTLPITSVAENFLFQRAHADDGELLAIQWPSSLQSRIDFSFHNQPVTLQPNELIRSFNSYSLHAHVFNDGSDPGICRVRFYAGGLKEENFIGETSDITLNPGAQSDASVAWSPVSFFEDPLLPFYVYAVIGKTSSAEAFTFNNVTYSEMAFEGQAQSCFVTAYCPVTLAVTTPDGKQIRADSSEVPGAMYTMDDFDNDGRLDQRVSFSASSRGIQYQVKVIPNSDASPTDHYTLVSQQGSQKHILADSVIISNTPSTPYIFTTTAVNELYTIPKDFSLSQNYPNPFNPSTTIRYGLPSKSRVTLTIYSTLGQLVTTLAKGEQGAGYHEVKFDGSRLASGMYFCRLQAGTHVETKKLLLLR